MNRKEGRKETKEIIIRKAKTISAILNVVTILELIPQLYNGFDILSDSSYNISDIGSSNESCILPLTIDFLYINLFFL